MRIFLLLRLFYLLVCSVVVAIIILVFLGPKEDFIFDYFDNQDGHSSPIVPNTVHFIIFERGTLDFTTFLSMTSVLKIQQPDYMLIHYNEVIKENQYVQLIKELANITTTKIIYTKYSPPTHVFGQPLSSVYHSSDVARIDVLMKSGGIYLDTDMIILKPLDKFFHFEMVVAWPPDEYIGNQILIAHKDARFLKLWLEGYRIYKPRLWYFNAGQYPTEQLLKKMPALAHIVPEKFGVHNLLKELHNKSEWEWREYYAVHLLARHPPTPILNETSISSYNSTFSEIARWILFTISPKLDIYIEPMKWIN